MRCAVGGRVSARGEALSFTYVLELKTLTRFFFVLHTVRTVVEHQPSGARRGGSPRGLTAPPPAAQ